MRPGAEDMMRRSNIAAVTLILIVGSAAGVLAQRWGRFRTPVDAPIDPAPQYDGRFTFARLKFTTGPGGYYFQGLPAWAHGYDDYSGKRSETNLDKILNSVTDINPHTDGTAVVDVGSPDLFRYPIVYATEPGYMQLDDKDVKNLRAYLLKGGFVIFDDFRNYDWDNFQQTMERVLPGEHLMQLDLKQPIFHAFFDIQTLNFVQAYDQRNGPATFYGMFPNNDPSKPMQIIANYNNDVSEYWQYSDTGFAPIDLSNEAYKYGVNYIIYAMTH
jgi:hypothetical protein